MYKVSHYTEQDKDLILGFMKQHNFAFVTGIGDYGPVATQLPLEVVEESGKLYLSGHLMRKTDHHLAFEKNKQVLAIFHSAHAYIYANWYSEPAQGSTVNYMSVHARGIIHFLDTAGTENEVKKITDKHIGGATAASFENISREYIDAMVKAIVGFKIEVTDLQNVFKLSQNRNMADQKNIIAQLEKRGEPGDLFIAEKMKSRL